VLKGKSKVLGTIEELERLGPLLREALIEERSTLQEAAQYAAEETARAAAELESAAKISELESVSCAASADVVYEGSILSRCSRSILVSNSRSSLRGRFIASIWSSWRRFEAHLLV
jgi:hypothetical protein